MSTTRLAQRVAAPVMEVFASIQGEGLFVGEPQVLLRLRGCPMRCRWCDTPGSWALGSADRARIDRPEGRIHEDTWATPFQAACWIAAVEPGVPRTVSVTGGEPLLWPEFLAALKPLVGSRRLHLETAGGHPRALERVIGAFDHVSLDLKPDFDLDPPQELEGVSERAPANAEEWRRARLVSLALVAGRDACGKIVVSGGRSPSRYAPLLEEVAAVAPSLPVVLQPATPVNGVSRPSAELVERTCELARELGLAVRVLPQVHRVLGLP